MVFGFVNVEDDLIEKMNWVVEDVVSKVKLIFVDVIKKMIFKDVMNLFMGEKDVVICYLESSIFE